MASFLRPVQSCGINLRGKQAGGRRLCMARRIGFSACFCNLLVHASRGSICRTIWSSVPPNGDGAERTCEEKQNSLMTPLSIQPCCSGEQPPLASRRAAATYTRPDCSLATPNWCRLLCLATSIDLHLIYDPPNSNVQLTAAFTSLVKLAPDV